MEDTTSNSSSGNNLRQLTPQQRMQEVMGIITEKGRGSPIVNQTQESDSLFKKRTKERRHPNNTGKWGKQGKEVCVSPRLMDITEASVYIGLKVDTIYHMVSQRRIPFVKVGRRTMFDVRLLDEWLERHTVLPIPQKMA